MGFLTTATQNLSPPLPPGHPPVSASSGAGTAVGRQSRTQGRRSRTRYR